jgi:hypothetical protein
MHSLLIAVNRFLKRVLGRIPLLNGVFGYLKKKLAVPIALRFLDKKHGLDTEGRVNLEELGIDPQNRVYYVPSGWFTMDHITAIVKLMTEDVLVDFGSGKGRMVFMVAHYPVKRIVGVEIAAELNAVAQENIRRNLHKLKCRNIQLITADVLDFEIPTDMTIAYFYNPFQGEVFKTVITRIRQSLTAHPRRLWLIYQSTQPNEHLEQCEWLSRVATNGNCWFYRPVETR